MNTLTKTHTTLETAGWLGVFLILTGYSMVSVGIISGDSTLYHGLMASGSLLVALISFKKKVLQPAVLNSMFLLLAVVALIRLSLL